VRDLALAGWRLRDIADAYGISERTVTKVRDRKRCYAT
jgi:DNA-binding NarL/FixJ family response regulator